MIIHRPIMIIIAISIIAFRAVFEEQVLIAPNKSLSKNRFKKKSKFLKWKKLISNLYLIIKRIIYFFKILEEKFKKVQLDRINFSRMDKNLMSKYKLWNTINL